MKRHYPLLFTVFALSCSPDEAAVESINQTETLIPELQTTETSTNWGYQTLENQDGTWGYKILDGANLYITQPYIPAVQGNQGFKSEEAAKITAEYVIYKLESGFSPPSISIRELDSLNVMN